MPDNQVSGQPAATINQWDQLTPYSPPRHTGTSNRRLLDGSSTNECFSVVHGAIEHGGEAESHYHAKSSQFLHLLTGSCRLTLENEPKSVEMSKGDSVFIPAGLRHQVEVTSREGITLINVYQPALAADDILS